MISQMLKLSQYNIWGTSPKICITEHKQSAVPNFAMEGGGVYWDPQKCFHDIWTTSNSSCKTHRTCLHLIKWKLKNWSQPLVINNIKDLNPFLEAKTEILTHQGVELRMKHALVRVDQPTNWCTKVLKVSKTVHDVLNVLQHVQMWSIVKCLLLGTALRCHVLYIRIGHWFL